MAYTIRGVDYFYATIPEEPAAGYRLLGTLRDEGVDLVAFSAVPFGPSRTQMALFPSDTAVLQAAAQRARLSLEGPLRALLVQGDDEMGALAEIHARLYGAGVRIYASSGVNDGQGRFGCVIYVSDGDYDRSIAALDL